MSRRLLARGGSGMRTCGVANRAAGDEDETLPVEVDEAVGFRSATVAAPAAAAVPTAGPDSSAGQAVAAPPAPEPTPTGLLGQLRTPPGGRDGRTMLIAFFVDRVGTGVWSAASVLYFTFVVGLGAREIGLLLGVGGAVGIAGSPLAGRLVGWFELRSVLIAS